MDDRVPTIWGWGLWEGLRKWGLQERATIYHVPGHQPLQAPGNDAANALAQVCSADVPAVLVDVGPWLHRKLGHVGARTMKQ